MYCNPLSSSHSYVVYLQMLLLPEQLNSSSSEMIEEYAGSYSYESPNMVVYLGIEWVLGNVRVISFPKPVGLQVLSRQV